MSLFSVIWTWYFPPRSSNPLIKNPGSAHATIQCSSLASLTHNSIETGDNMTYALGMRRVTKKQIVVSDKYSSERDYGTYRYSEQRILRRDRVIVRSNQSLHY